MTEGGNGTDEIVAQLQAALGASVVLPGHACADRRFADWSGVPAAVPLALIRPRTTAEVALAMAICHAAGQPVVVQGGLTGLSGGACVQPGEVALSLERMTGVESLDPVSGTMTVWAGTTLQAAQDAAEAAGLYLALDLGARGSCTIGGNIATNAGGVRVIKYGMMRDQLLGVEAVLADGRIVSDLHAMVKNNTGYDFRNLLAASEGTLAVITRAVLRLRAMPTATATAWCALPDFEAVKQFMVAARGRLAENLSAFEVMWSSFAEGILAHVPGLRRPVAGAHAFHVLIESSGTDRGQIDAAFEAFLADGLERGWLSDVAIAQSDNDARAFWAIRECPEMATMIPHPVVFDISVATGEIGELADRCEAAIAARWPASRFVALGHMGDGNIHVIVEAPDASHAAHDAVEDVIYGCVGDMHGSVSAEHGIGIKKRRVLHHSRDAVDVALMRGVKAAFDPADILGRGRLLPA